LLYIVLCLVTLTLEPLCEMSTAAMYCMSGNEPFVRCHKDTGRKHKFFKALVLETTHVGVFRLGEA